MENKYTFDNWWNGEVTLIYASVFHPKNEVPQRASWDDFSSEDVNKIKEEQERLFIESVNILLKQHSDQFLKRYSKSQLKTEFLEREITECLNIFENNINGKQIIHFEHWGISLEENYIDEIRQYYHRTILKGIDDGFEFIHSPNCFFQINRTDSRIYANFVWEYFKWLKSFALQVKNKRSFDIKNEVKIWFRVGIKFATGEIDELIKKYESNPGPYYSKIEREIGIKNSRNYISGSYLGTKKDDKNIFADETKVNQIKEYCIQNKI